MRFRKEVIRVDACRKERRYLSNGRLGLNRRCEHDEIRFDRDLLVINQIRALHHQFSILVIYLADHTFDIINAILFYRAAIEFVVVFTRGTHVDIEYVHFGVGIFFTNKHCVLCGIHTTNFRTIRFTATARITRAYALNERDHFRMLAVGRTKQHAVRRTCRVHQSFKLQRRDNVFVIRVAIFVKVIKSDGFEARSNHDRAIFALNKRVFLFVINRARAAEFLTNSAFARFQFNTLLGIDHRNVRDRLCKRDMNCRAIV